MISSRPTPSTALSSQERIAGPSRYRWEILGSRLRGWSRQLRAALDDGARLRGWVKHRLGSGWGRRPSSARRLHIGCGPERLAGWCNIDLLPLANVDVCLDITRSFPFSDVSHIFAEHFLEHLEIDDALDFLSASRRSLEDGGWIRLSTPNLDWVWSHLYDRRPGGRRERKALHLNRAFYGWRHRFLWNRELLEMALVAAGFESIRWCSYGESELQDFRGLERHERNDDTPDLPHVLIAEARKGLSRPGEMALLRRILSEEFLVCRA